MTTLAQIHADIMRRLPPTTRTLVEVLGWEGTFHFLRRHGGKKIYFPIFGARRKDSWIDEYPQETQLALSESFGGQEVRMPRTSRMLRAERNNQILKDLDRGFTPDEICEKYSVSRRWLNQIRALIGGKTPPA